MIGRTLHHYELLDELGQGGMGVVYKARDSRLNRFVAIKLLTPGTASDPAHRARFLREASAASALNHPGIVTIYDIGSEGGIDYIAMELAAGHPLSEMIPSTGLPQPEALRITRQIAAALQCAHEAGIVHRDLKPGNIMIGPGGAAKILDFGLAKRGEVEKAFGATTMPQLTSPGTVMGTAAYMAPEQAEGREVDARADVFSLGVILYEMLSGRSPFQRDSSASTLAAVLRDAPPTIRGLARPLTTVLERALQKERHLRYPDAGHMLAALDAAVTDPAVEQSERSEPFVAVLPFANLSPDPDNEYFCDGLSEEILNLLARTPDLRVIARTSAFAWKGKSEDVRTIGAKLGVDSVLEGSVRRLGDRLRVTAQLVNATDGRPLWSSRYDRTLTDLFAVQDEIATEVVRALQGKLVVPRPAPDVAAGPAHDAYLRGRYQWNRFTMDSIVKALGLFEQARALDPSYALPYVGIADCYLQLGHSRAGYMPPLEGFPKARAAVEIALKLSPDLADAHCSLACCLYWHDWDWEGAEREFRRAIELNPNHATSRQWYSLFLATMRRFDEAEDEIQRALGLDPFSPLVVSYWIGTAYFAGKYELAIERFDRLSEIAPDYPWGLHWLALTYAELGDYGRGIELLERALKLSPGMTAALGRLGFFYGVSGQPDRTREVIAECDRLSATRFIDPLLRAWSWAGLGDVSTALCLYEEAFALKSPIFTIVPVDPPSIRLAKSPGFPELYRRLHYPVPGFPD